MGVRGSVEDSEHRLLSGGAAPGTGGPTTTEGAGPLTAATDVSRLRASYVIHVAVSMNGTGIWQVPAAQIPMGQSPLVLHDLIKLDTKSMPVTLPAGS